MKFEELIFPVLFIGKTTPLDKVIDTRSQPVDVSESAKERWIVGH